MNVIFYALLGSLKDGFEWCELETKRGGNPFALDAARILSGLSEDLAERLASYPDQADVCKKLTKVKGKFDRLTHPEPKAPKPRKRKACQCKGKEGCPDCAKGKTS